MAKRLTEEMVIARTKISDLGKIKRLNCWGSELVDVSLLRKMPSVEVLSLSINKINSLVDFQFCKRLEELYIRQNDIRDLNEVVFLQNLPNLKNLWLGENPCANVDGYRLAVIKALPQLQKLDNVQVTQEDLREAQRKGRTLTHPDDAQESEEEYVQPPQQPQQYNKYQDYSESEYSPVQRSPPRQEPDYEIEESEDLYPREEVSEESKDYSPPRQPSPPRRTEPARKSFSPEPVYVERRRNSYERESPKQQQPPQYYDEYTNGDRYLHGQPQYREPDVSSTHSHERRERYVCPAAHRAPFTRRPVTRNSNILSAVLRLVKELDYPSLEVVEMEVRSRMDELDE
ncbi:acidic leucine-rich nuclear phosphoprotein 32 family member A-like isoform X3 [Zophobas morio]|uniref:acidic leucine-rich nuclear phosphoprotein 32 family member A-like isoform X3 n=1 Tax=Zophobas morio TaxID=2755281 RepID=UPI003082EE03